MLLCSPLHARSGEIAFSVLSIVMQFAVITAVGHGHLVGKARS